MYILSLVENTSDNEFAEAHGLSFYVETAHHKLLFDLGPDGTIFKNARIAGIDLSLVDTIILSHGHYDHCGALREVLDMYPSVNVFIRDGAFKPHYNVTGGMHKYIGIDGSLENDPRIHVLTDDRDIDGELHVFTAKERDLCFSPMNNVLYEEDSPDNFSHEQNLIIREGSSTVLLCGCGHCGIVNILKSAEKFNPRVCIGGFHLSNPTNGDTVSRELLDDIASNLKGRNMTFYTCHCTGLKPFDYLSSKCDNVHYLSCGQSLKI